MPVLISAANKALLVPPSPAVANLFPGAPEAAGHVIVKHDIQSTLMLRHIGFKVPSPIVTYYDFPSPADEPATEVQKKSTELCTENTHAYVLNDKGTGKTRVLAWSWDFLNRNGLCQKMLVVCPRSTMYFTWAAEFFKCLPERKVAVLYGGKRATKKDRLVKLAEDADVYIINHDGLRVVRKEIEQRPDINVLVLDESAVYRNNSERSKEMRKFARRFPIVWGATGSPMPQEPTDVWGQAQIVTPHTAPKRFKDARDMLMVQISPYVWRPKANAVETAYQMLTPNVRYTLEEVAELPPLISRDLDANLSEQQQKIYDKVSKEMTALLETGRVTAVNKGVMLSKLVQIAGGWVYTTNPDFVQLDAEPRIEALIEEIEESAAKVLVFVPYRHMIDGLSVILTERKIEHCVVHGDTSDRDLYFNAFQNTPQYKAMLCHPGCVHHGITLTAADTAIWYCPVLSFDIYDQANARFRRLGQTKKQHLLHFSACAAEQKCYRMLRQREVLQDRLLEMLQAATAERDAKRTRSVR